METSVSTESIFVKPHFIQILGEEGLTAHEIAISLGANPADVIKKIKRGKWYTQDVQYWRVMTYTFANETNGLDVESYVLNTRAAKAFVARWNNERSDAYLNFLFDCEYVATEMTPKLIAEIKELKEKLLANEAASIKRDKKLLRAVRKGMVLAPVYQQTLFGIELNWQMKQKETLNEVERLKSEIRHLNEMSKRFDNSRIEKHEKLDQAELKNKNEILSLVIQ